MHVHIQRFAALAERLSDSLLLLLVTTYYLPLATRFVAYEALAERLDLPPDSCVFMVNECDGRPGPSQLLGTTYYLLLTA